MNLTTERILVNVEIRKLKEENESVLHLPRYDKKRKDVLDRNSKKIEELTKEDLMNLTERSDG